MDRYLEDIIMKLTRRGLALSAAALFLGTRAQAGKRRKFEVTRTDEEWRRSLTAEQYSVLRKDGTERAGVQSSQRRKAQRNVPLRRMRSAAVLFRDQVRERHWVAELLAAT